VEAEVRLEPGASSFMMSRDLGRALDLHHARLRLDERTSDALELEYPEVARNRASLAWCAALAERVAGLARALVAGRGSADARAR